MPLSKIERETIISFNEAEDTANVYTCNAALRRRLAKEAAEKPDKCTQEPSPNEYADSFTVPKSWVKIKPPKAVSDAQKAQLSARLYSAREKRSSCSISVQRVPSFTPYH